MNVFNHVPSEYQLKSGMGLSEETDLQIEPLITIEKLIGAGSYGCVFKAKMRNREHPVVVKQTVKNVVSEREFTLLQTAEHCNVVELITSAKLQMGPQHDKLFELIVMEYLPMSLHDFIVAQNKQPLDFIYVRVLSYQMFRALSYLSTLKICHRDIKPGNILLNPETFVLKLADFGCAKLIEAGAPNRTYICSRYYRPPELFANSLYYDMKVDIWSAGCVLGELIKGSPIFSSTYRGNRQLLYIVQILGTTGFATVPELQRISIEFNVPEGNGVSDRILLGRDVPKDLLKLMKECLRYDPERRIKPMSACAHWSFDELRNMETLKMKLPNNVELPPLFNFTKAETDPHPELLVSLLPIYYQNLERNDDKNVYNLVEVQASEGLPVATAKTSPHNQPQETFSYNPNGHEEQQHPVEEPEISSSNQTDNNYIKQENPFAFGQQIPLPYNNTTDQVSYTNLNLIKPEFPSTENGYTQLIPTTNNAQLLQPNESAVNDYPWDPTITTAQQANIHNNSIQEQLIPSTSNTDATPLLSSTYNSNNNQLEPSSITNITNQLPPFYNSFPVISNIGHTNEFNSTTNNYPSLPLDLIEHQMQSYTYIDPMEQVPSTQYILGQPSSIYVHPIQIASTSNMDLTQLIPYTNNIEPMDTSTDPLELTSTSTNITKPSATANNNNILSNSVSAPLSNDPTTNNTTLSEISMYNDPLVLMSATTNTTDEESSTEIIIEFDQM